MGTSTSTVNTIAYNKANQEAERVRRQAQNDLENYKRQMARENAQTEKRFQREMEHQRKMTNQKLELDRLEREKELELLNARETMEESKRNCKISMNSEFDGEFGGVTLDLNIAPDCFKHLEKDQEKYLISILSDVQEKNQEILHKVQDESGWVKDDCEKVVDWYFNPDSRIVAEDEGMIEALRVVTEIAVLNFKQLQNLDNILKAIEIMFKDLPNNVKPLLKEVAMNCIDTIKQAKSLTSVERTKTDQMIAKVDMADGETMTIRIRTALCFKYIKQTIQNQDIDESTPQIMGETEQQIVETEQQLQQPEDVRVVVCFRTTVHHMETVEGSMNQQQCEAIQSTGWF